MSNNGKALPEWNDIPFDESSPAAAKAQEFDLQVEENGGDPNFTKNWQEPE